MTHSVRSKAAVAAAALLTAASLAACSANAESDSAGTSGSSGSSSGRSAGVAHAQDQITKYAAARDHFGTPAPVSNVPDLHGKTVWYVPIGTSVPVLATMGTAISEGLGHLGAKVQVCDGKFTPTTVASCMESAGTQHASAVITGFVDYNVVPSAFQGLAAKGIPVLAAGVAQPDGVSSSKTLGFFDTSELTQTAYRLMADATIADSDGSAKVLQVELADSPITKSNTAATTAEFEKQCPDCQVTTVSMTTADATNLGSLIGAKLSANPDTKYLLLPQDAFLQAALPGLQSAGFADKVKIVTAGGSTAGLQATKAGQIAYDIGQGAVEQGWAIADGAVRLLSGAEVQPETDGPVRVFTPDNVGQLELTDANYNSSAWYGGDAWKQDFLGAWGAE